MRRGRKHSLEIGQLVRIQTCLVLLLHLKTGPVDHEIQKEPLELARKNHRELIPIQVLAGGV